MTGDQKKKKLQREKTRLCVEKLRQRRKEEKQTEVRTQFEFSFRKNQRHNSQRT